MLLTLGFVKGLSDCIYRYTVYVSIDTNLNSNLSKTMPSSVFTVESRTLNVGMRLKNRRLPLLEIRRSLIENAGLGLFAAELIRKGELITEYGGRVVHRADAEKLRLEGADTHLRAVVLGREALDGRIQEPIYTHEYYAENHLAGSFANESSESVGRNAIYFNTLGFGRIHPSGEVATGRVFLKATDNIQPGEEILVNYGTTYRRLHLQKSVLNS